MTSRLRAAVPRCCRCASTRQRLASWCRRRPCWFQSLDQARQVQRPCCTLPLERLPLLTVQQTVHQTTRPEIQLPRPVTVLSSCNTLPFSHHDLSHLAATEMIAVHRTNAIRPPSRRCPRSVLGVCSSYGILRTCRAAASSWPLSSLLM